MVGDAGFEPATLNFKGDGKKMVGDAGFEPATLWSQTRCATGLR